jgi:Polymer-forming cytoskeletal
VIINGDYEGDVDCGGRFEIGATGRVKGAVKTQVLVVKEGAHWEGSVTMTREPGSRPAAQQSQQQQSRSGSSSSSSSPTGPGSASSGNGPSIFSKQDREEAMAGDRQAGSGGSQ